MSRNTERIWARAASLVSWSWARPTRKRKSSRADRTSYSRRVFLEGLEDRRLLAADLLNDPVGPVDIWEPILESLNDPALPHEDFAAATASENEAIGFISWQGAEVAVLRNEWIVSFAETVPPDSVSTHIELALDATAAALDSSTAGIDKNAVSVERQLGGDGAYLLRFDPAADSSLVLDVLEDTPGFRYIEPNFVVSINATPNDPDYSLLRGLHQTNDADIDAPEAWDLTTGSGQVVVGVIDSGVDYTHPDLANNIWVNPVECPAGYGTCIEDGVDDDGNGFVDDFYGWDFENDDNDPSDDHSHGTHVAGTVAAVGNNGIGVVGVNWNAQIMALRFIGASGSGSTADAVDAINYATMMKKDHGVNIRVTNNSWGGGSPSQALEDAIAASGAEDMLFVAAAGNDTLDNDATPHYPSSYTLDNIIAVAATDTSDGLASFSNTGAVSVDLGAPGSNTYSTVPGGVYGYKSGTSMASPHVAGVAALAWDADPGASYTDVRNAILSNVDPLAALNGETVTGGRLNAFKTLEAMGFFAQAISPSTDEVVATAPTSFTIDFSQNYDASTVSGSDFTVNGIQATGRTLVDADTVDFTFAISPVTAEGPQTMALAADSIERSSDADGLAAFSTGFFYDPTPLVVAATTPASGSILTPSRSDAPR